MTDNFAFLCTGQFKVEKILNTHSSTHEKVTYSVGRCHPNILQNIVLNEKNLLLILCFFCTAGYASSRLSIAVSEVE